VGLHIRPHHGLTLFHDAQFIDFPRKGEFVLPRLGLLLFVVGHRSKHTKRDLRVHGDKHIFVVTIRGVYKRIGGKLRGDLQIVKCTVSACSGAVVTLDAPDSVRALTKQNKKQDIWNKHVCACDEHNIQRH